jgi:hypothetical protein
MSCSRFVCNACAVLRVRALVSACVHSGLMGGGLSSGTCRLGCGSGSRAAAWRTSRSSTGGRAPSSSKPSPATMVRASPPPPSPCAFLGFRWLTAHRGRARWRAGGADSGGGHAVPALVDSQRLRSVQEPVDQLGGGRRVEPRVVRRRHGLLPGLQGDRRHPRPLQSRVRAHNPSKSPVSSDPCVVCVCRVCRVCVVSWPRLIPIGAYCPRDFMQPQHIDPAVLLSSPLPAEETR